MKRCSDVNLIRYSANRQIKLW